MTTQAENITEPVIPALTSLTGELQVPVFRDMTAAAINNATTAAAATVKTAANTAQAALTGDASLMDQAVDALGEAEANKFVAALEGDEEVDTAMLRKIAGKILAGPLKDSFKAKRAQQALDATVKALRAEIDALKSGQQQTQQTLTTSQEEQAKAARFNSLSTACAAEKIDLESALLDKDIATVLNTKGKDEHSALTLSQEISQWMLRGDFAKAAKLVQVAVSMAKPEQSTEGKPVAPAGTAAMPVEVVEKTYEQEIAEITQTYSRSNKTFADGQARAAKLNALKTKHGRT